MFVRVRTTVQAIERAAQRCIHELCRDADRSAGPPGRGSAVSQRRGRLRRRSEARRACCTRWCCAAPWRMAASTAIDASAARAHAGRACGHHRGRYRRRHSVDPAAARQPAGIQALPAAGHRQGQGALRRRADRGGGGRDARRWPKTRWKRSRSISSRCRRCRTAMRRRRDKSLLFEASGSNRAVRYAATFGDADAAFAKAEYTRKENVPLPSPDRTAAGDPRPDRRMGCGEQRLTVFGATKVLFFNRRTLAPMLGVTEADIDMIEVDVGGGFGVKGEFYPEDFLIPFAARLVGRPVKWIEDRREHLIATNHSREVDCELEIACTRDGTHPRPCAATSSADMGAYIRTNGGVVPAKAGAIPAGAVPHPRRRAHGRGASITSKTPVGTLAGAGAVRGEFLPRAAARHRGARSRPRSDGISPQEPDQRGRAAVRTPASSCPTSARPISTPATITPPSSARCARSAGPRRNRCRAG